MPLNKYICHTALLAWSTHKPYINGKLSGCPPQHFAVRMSEDKLKLENASLLDELKFQSEFFMRQPCKRDGICIPLLQVTSMMQLVVAGKVGPAFSVLSHHTKMS